MADGRNGPELVDLDLEGLVVLGACDNYTPQSSGGAERAAHEIYLRLGRAGAMVWVLGAPFGDGYQDHNVSLVALRGLDLSRFAGGYMALVPAAFGTSSKLIRQHRPTVLHANTLHYNGCVALARAARRTGTPLVVTAQVGSMSQMPLITRTLSGAYDRTVGRYILRRSSRVLAVSQPVVDHVVQLGAEGPALHHGDAPRVHLGVDDRIARTRSDDDQIEVLGVARFTHPTSIAALGPAPSDGGNSGGAAAARRG